VSRGNFTQHLGEHNAERGVSKSGVVLAWRSADGIRDRVTCCD